MALVHRNTDGRACGATTTVVGQGTVIANGQLISVEQDPNTDGGGNLEPSIGDGTVIIEGKKIIVAGCSAAPDSLCPEPGGAHCAPTATGSSKDVSAY